MRREFSNLFLSLLDSTENRIFKIINIGFFIVISLFIFSFTPNQGYMPDLYNQIPYSFWLIILILLVIIQVKIIKYGNLRLLAFIGLISLFLLSLPLIKGYFIYGRGDVLTHLGWIKDIIIFNQLPQGHYYPENIYPLMHILGVIFAFFGITIENQTIIVPIIFNLVFFSFMYLFLRKFFKKRILKFVMPIGFLLLYTSHLFYAPNVLAYLYIPTILFCGIQISKKDNREWKFLTLILLISQIFFHPVIFLYVLVLLFLFNVLKMLIICRSIRNIVKSNFILIPIILIYFQWYSGFGRFIKGFRSSIYSFLMILSDSSLHPDAARHIKSMNLYNIGIFEGFKILVFRFGPFLFSSLLSVILILIFIKEWKRENTKTNSKLGKLFLISGFIGFSFFGLINFSINFVTYTRIFKMIKLFTIPLSGLFIFKVYERNKKYLWVLILLIIITFSFLSVLTLYPSSVSKQNGQQVSFSEYRGTKWFLKNRDHNFPIYEIGIGQWRFSHAIYGVYSTYKYKEKITKGTKVEDHFGYHKYKSIGSIYKDNSYLLISDFSLKTFKKIYPKYHDYWSWNTKDYKVLRNDQTANKIYENGEIRSFQVNQ